MEVFRQVAAGTLTPEQGADLLAVPEQRGMDWTLIIIVLAFVAIAIWGTP